MMKPGSDKNIDFKVLRDASDIVLDKLREDESVPDLKDQFVEKVNGGNHKYFLEPYFRQWKHPIMKHSNFKPLPNGLLEHFRNVESASFMGLLPEINRAWLTIDNKLFLWDLGETDQYTVYDGIDDIIVSVALAVPKANMFISTIKYFLVVATTVEVLLLALSWDDDYIEGHQLQNGLVHGGGSRSHNESIPTSPAFSASKKKSELRVLPTKYIIPTDNVTVIKVMGSTNGRIFMAGVDGNVHEVCYDYTEDVGALAWGARLLHDYIEGVEEDEDFDTDGASKKRRRSNMKGTYKCQKVVHNTYKFQMVNLLLPDFVKDYIGLNDCLSDAVLDDVRHVLYAITVKGKIHVFHLGLDGLAMELVVTDYHIMTELVKYLRYNSSRGDIMPNAEQVRDGYDSGLIEIVSFHVVPITESKNVHGVVVLSNGIRVYISLRDGYNDSYFSTNYTTPPNRLEILHIRNPPPSEVLSTLKFSDTGGKNLSYGVGKNGLDNIKQNINYRDDGVLPKYTPHDSLKLHASYYCHGLFLGAHSDDKQEVGDDVLYSMNEDLVTRNHANPLLNTEASADTLSQQPGLRETVCVVQPSGQGVSARTHSMGGKVYDIKEVCNDLYNYDASMLHTMVVCSKTPPATSVALKPVGGGIPTSSGPSGTANGTAAPSCTSNMEAYSGPSASVVPPLGRSKYTGLDVKSTRTQPISSSNISSGTGIPNIAKLSELVTQSVVSLPPVTLQRQIYCLTNNGLHTIIKLRPIDYMLEILSTASTNETYLEQMHSFFRCYGSVQSSVMCLSIACNTPFECGSNATVRMKAITAIQRLTDGPSYTVVSNTSNNASDTLFDSRFSNTTSGTVLSKKFCYSAMHNALQVFTSRILRPIWLKTIVVENKISPLFKIEIITSIKETLMALLSILTEYYHSVVTAHELSLNIEVLRDTDDRNYLSSHARMVEDASIYRMCRVISRSIHALNLLEVISVSICIDLNLPLDFIADQVWARLAGIDFYTFVVSMDVHSLVKDIIRSICDRAVFLKNDVHICDLFVNKLTTYCYSYFCESDRLEYETTKALSKLENLPRESHEIKYYLDQSISLLLQQCAYWDSVDCVSAHNRSEHNLSENCKKLRVYGSKIQVSHAQDASLDLDMHRTPKTGSALYYYEKVVNTIVDICLITANYFGGGIIPNSDTHYSMSRMNVPLSNSNALTNGSSSNASSFEEYERMLYRGGGLIVVDSNMGVSDTAINRAREECYSTLWSNVMAIKAAPSSGIGSGTVANKSDAAVVEEAMRDPAIAYRLVVAMVTRALNSSDDITLHNLIYSNLYGEGEKDLLMRLEANVYMDDYLRQVDPLLLYKNYEYHGRFSDAADLMISLATTASDSADQGDLPNISERVQYLTYAVRSGTNAVTMTGQDTSSISSNFTVDHVTNMQDQLTVAKLQAMVYEELSGQLHSIDHSMASSSAPLTENQLREIENLRKIVWSLNYELKAISELYHMATDPYKLWELSLKIMKVANHREAPLINKLWRSIMYKAIPEKSNVSVNSAFLDSKRADTSNTGLIVDRRHQRRDCYFEEVSMWHSELVNKITGLGSYLLHEGNENAAVAATVGLSGTTNYTLTASGQSEIAPNIQTIQNDNQIIFPLVVIIEELEEVSSYMNSGIASVETGSKQKHWVVDMLKDLGYTYGVLAESYVLCLQRNDGKRIEVMQSLMASLLYILDQWIHVVETTPSTKASASPLLTIEHTELLQTIRSQSIRGWCDRMRHHMHILKGQHMSQACKTQLDSQLIALQSIEDRILHLIVI